MQPPTAAVPASRYRLAFSSRLALLASVLFADKIFLNSFVDFERADEAHGLGAVIRVGQHFGFRFAVALAAATALFAYIRDEPQLHSTIAAARTAPLRLGWAFLHLLLLAPLALLSHALYRHTPTDLSIAAAAAAWILLGAAAGLSVALALLPGRLWLELARGIGTVWGYALLAAVCGTAVLQLSQQLWQWAAVLTFDLVRGLLSPMLPSLSADPSTLVLDTGRFAIQVAEVCSGLEGVGLALAFSAAWLLCFRREYYFPRALLLIPAAMLASFALNVLRISALVLIGDAGFEDTAVFGFHSQAGWIAFILIACGLVVVSRRSAWLSRRATTSPSQATHNPTATYLMPLLAILGVSMVSRALSGPFEYFYPLRLFAAALAMWIYRKELRRLDWGFSWRAVAVGCGVFAMWLLAAHWLISAEAMPSELADMPPASRGLWLACRLSASILAVPIAEELAYRGFLMRRINHSDFDLVSYTAVRWPALCASALVFGLAHGALWLPASAAGLAYGYLLVKRGRLGEAVAAHATTNGLLAVSVLYGHEWQLM